MISFSVSQTFVQLSVMYVVFNVYALFYLSPTKEEVYAIDHDVCLSVC